MEDSNFGKSGAFFHDHSSNYPYSSNENQTKYPGGKEETDSDKCKTISKRFVIERHRPSYVLSGASGCPDILNGELPVPSATSKRFARRPCFELLCTNMLSEMARRGPSTVTWVAITTWKQR